jgi:hypothetical protein
MAGFEFVRSVGGQRDIPVKRQMVASGTITKGDGLEFSSGKLQRANAQTDKPLFIAAEDATSTSTSQTLVAMYPHGAGQNIFRVAFTPLVDGLACQSNASTTTVKVALTDGSSSDLVGGLVYVVELDQYRVITANTYSSNVVTITVAEAFTTAPTTTHTCRVVPFGFGTTALKLDSSNPHKAISNAIADLTGGNVRIWDVDMKRKVAEVVFPYIV